jgi:LysR family transcriptional regulator, glycine cleavage system transcriptional activator
MARLPLHTLPTFQAVAKLQNLRSAADTLHITHSAVSQQIKVLEEQLGFALFDRRGRRVVLNAAGQALLRAVEPALAQLDDGVQAAGAAASGAAQRLRVTMLPSFANRWLLPRMARWRERHPELAIEIDATPQVVDLLRDGMHAAIRQGIGPWPGLVAERFFDKPMPFMVVGSASAAQRLRGAPPDVLAREPLLGDADVWEAWFAAAGVKARVSPVATFNDAGLMLLATEQNLGLSVVRELLAADALVAGRLVQLSPLTIPFEAAYEYHFVYPAALRGWAPLKALRDWLREELEASMRALHPPVGKRRKG